MVISHGHELRCLSVVFSTFLPISIAGVSSAASDDWRPAIYVAVDREARMFVDGNHVDTLAVHRGQKICFVKRDEDGPDLTVRFGRKLFHPRQPARAVLTADGRPRYLRVSNRAKMRLYDGTPERGFAFSSAAGRPIVIRVIPPPDSQSR